MLINVDEINVGCFLNWLMTAGLKPILLLLFNPGMGVT
jgi:hypothetical protein